MNSQNQEKTAKTKVWTVVREQRIKLIWSLKDYQRSLNVIEKKILQSCVTQFPFNG